MRYGGYVGYDAHITRAEQWFDSEQSPIPLADWLAYISSDPEFRLDGFAEATTPQGETIRTESEGLAIWTKYSKDGLGGNMALFDFFEDHIIVKNPDEEILGKMINVAEALGARVQGDDGEDYDTPPPPPRPKSEPSARPLWKRLFGG
jgi:hypothetical protein